jgi:hypothetical protein
VSDTLDQDHAQAFLGLLAGNATLTTFEGEVTNPTPDPPYVVVYPVVTWPADADGTALTNQQVVVSASFYCHCVGLSDPAARAVGMQVRSTVLNARPVVSGRSCGLIRQADSQPPQRDDSTGRAVFSALAVYSFTSHPG